MSSGCLVARPFVAAVLWPLIYGRRAVARIFYTNADLVLRAAGLDAALRLLRDAGCGHNPTILKALGASIGSGCMIHSPLLIQSPARSLERLKIGDGVHIGQDVFLDLTDTVEVGSNVTMSMRCTIITHMDVGRSPLSQGTYRSASKSVRLGEGCYLGAGAVVLAGVSVGACAIIGAGAVVTADVPAGAMVGGVPAKPLRTATSTFDAVRTLVGESQ